MSDSYKSWHKPTKNSYNAESGKLKAGQTHQGYYKVSNRSKYLGDPELVIFRSAWEYRFCRFCDMSQSVKRWSSEPVTVPYYDRVSKLEECAKLGLNPNDPSNWEVKNYHTDFWFELDNGTEIEKIFVEIKPSRELKKPLPPPRDSALKEQRKFNKAAKSYLVNEAKFAAMKEWSERNNCKFYVFTEQTLERIIGRFWHENIDWKKING